MPRYPSDHKDATRRRILDTAGMRFKEDGLDGSGIATLMRDAGLTNGAFYTHFTSKDGLIAAVVADQLEAQAQDIAAAIASGATLATYIETYLSTGHLRDAAGGCPSAALLTDVTRSSAAVRQAYQDGVVVLIDIVAKALVREGGSEETDAQSNALGIVASLIGTMQLARGLADPESAEQVLHMGRQSCLARLRHY